MRKIWNIQKPPVDQIKSICKMLNCTPTTAAILANRNISTEAELDIFLNAGLHHLRSPFTLADMDIAVKRIARAIVNREKILIFGDYDVDGITGTTILYEFLTNAGANVGWYIPHRIKEGYSIHPNHIYHQAIPNNVRLIITVDCGSTSDDAIQAAKSAGIDVIVTDHHNMSKALRGAYAVINPKRHDCKSGLVQLAGVGVAFYLLISLRKHLRDIGIWGNRPEPNLKNMCDLVSLGTIADMVPLTHENRIFSKVGLDVIHSGYRPSMNGLIRVSGIGVNTVDEEAIAFRLAPRLNAAGRMDHAETAMKLLISKDNETIQEISQKLNTLNRFRQDIEKEMIHDIMGHIQKYPDILQRKSIVLAQQEWHEGILGIVASRIVNKYHRPVILLSIRNGIAKGSGRSIPGVNLHDGLQACSSDLIQFGGHSMAAGLKIKSDQIRMFQEHFEDSITRIAPPEAFLNIIQIDCELQFEDICDKLLNEIEMLKPFGASNAEPMFMTRQVMVVSSKIVGDKHRQMQLKQVGSQRVFQAIQFNIDPSIPLPDCFDQIGYRLRWNRWNGGETPQIIIEET